MVKKKKKGPNFRFGLRPPKSLGRPWCDGRYGYVNVEIRHVFVLKEKLCEGCGPCGETK